MRRSRLLVTLILLAFSLCAVGVASAKPGGPTGNGSGNGDPKPPKARVTWSVPRVDATVAAGETRQVKVTLTASADMTNVTLVPRGGLARVLKVEPSRVATLKAGVPTDVTLTISVPDGGAQCQGGVVQVRSGKKANPAHLQVKVTVPGASGCGA